MAAVMAGRRILVVDDNADAAGAVAMLLESEGHDVRTASTGTLALTEVTRWSPDVVLLDIGLPDMDGYEVARAITALPVSPAPLLIALSGYGRPDDLQQAREAGFAHHLLKPAEPAALFALLGPVHAVG